MIKLITFSDDKMMRSAQLCGKSAEKHGVDEAACVIGSAICDNFKLINRDIFDGKRGAGCYWLFKPYVINGMMLNLQDGDILIYADAGIEFVNSVHHIIDRMDQNAFLFTNTHPQFHWCKRETMIAMNVPERLDIGQVQASVMVFKVCEETRNFVKEWLLWCQMPNLINDKKWMIQASEFQDHRHDQAIATNLAYKYNYRLHWWPTAYAEHIRVPGDDYPVLFNHHRKRDPGKGDGQPEW